MLPKCDVDMKMLISAVGLEQRVDFSVSASVIPPELVASTANLLFPDCLVGEKAVWMSVMYQKLII